MHSCYHLGHVGDWGRKVNFQNYGVLNILRSFLCMVDIATRIYVE